MALGKTVRFEIFKRDSFTCRYCGKGTPDVILEIDHVVPRIEGGSDDPTNLVTACFDCNRGKGRHRLTEVKTGESAYDRAVELMEQERQIEELEFVQMRIEQRIDDDMVWLANFYKIPKQNKSSFRRFLRSHPRSQIKEACDIACEKFGNAPTNYIADILKNWKNNGSH